MNPPLLCKDVGNTATVEIVITWLTELLVDAKIDLYFGVRPLGTECFVQNSANYKERCAGIQHLCSVEHINLSLMYPLRKV